MIQTNILIGDFNKFIEQCNKLIFSGNGTCNFCNVYKYGIATIGEVKVTPEKAVKLGCGNGIYYWNIGICQDCFKKLAKKNGFEITDFVGMED